MNTGGKHQLYIHFTKSLGLQDNEDISIKQPGTQIHI